MIIIRLCLIKKHAAACFLCSVGCPGKYPAEIDLIYGKLTENIFEQFLQLIVVIRKLENGSVIIHAAEKHYFVDKRQCGKLFFAEIIFLSDYTERMNQAVKAFLANVGIVYFKPDVIFGKLFSRYHRNVEEMCYAGVESAVIDIAEPDEVTVARKQMIVALLLAVKE